MYSLSIPIGRHGPSSQTAEKQFVPAQPRVTEGFRKPIVTSKWWTGALWAFHTDSFCANLYPHPLALRPVPGGMGLCYPTEVKMSADMRMYSYPYAEDMCVGLTGLESSDIQVADYSDWTATLRWQQGANELLAIAGHGLPYVFFERSGSASAHLRFATEPDIWADEGDTLAVTVGDRHYAAFGPSGSCWVRMGACEWTNNLAGQSFWSVAALPGKRADILADFKRHAHVVVTDSRVEWRYDPTVATVQTYFTVKTLVRQGDETCPLLALYPHQWKNTDSVPTDHRYGTPRGVMKVFCLREFSTSLPCAGLLPFMPTPDDLDRAQLWRRIDSIGSDEGPPAWQRPLEGESENDAYWSGKALGRLAHLAHLADEVGHGKARERFLAVIRDKLACFFDGAAEPCFYYDKTWQSLIFYPAAEHLLDTSLNDHQYSYGYFLRAVATLLHFDPEWWRCGDNATMVHAQGGIINS